MRGIKRALLSVSDKSGLVEFAQGLQKLGIELFASGGTARALKEAGIAVEEIDEYAQQSEMLGGRVKTLQPKLYAAILARRDDDEHMSELKEQGIEPIDLVVVNLYPFEAQVKAETATKEAMEYVDIGGTALIRAAAKNHEFVGVIVSPSDYERVLAELESSKELGKTTARVLAENAFQHVARYNSVISKWFAAENPLPEMMTSVEPKELDLRYGENPHQRSALYTSGEHLMQLQGKELSYVNLIDADSAHKCAVEFERPTAVIIKHTTPCGVASADDLAAAFERAYRADPKSAFGGVIGLNREVDESTARQISEQFFEVVVAPSFSEQAMSVLEQKPNLRLLEAPNQRFDSTASFRSTAFGIVAQTPSSLRLDKGELKVMTSRQPSDREIEDAIFGWRVCKHVLSNAIVLASGECTTGIGGGQVNRVDAARHAIQRAGELASGSVLASDAFIPFPDTVNIAAASGISVIIQTGGSVRDEEVLQAAEEQNISMIFTGVREFRH